MGNKLNSFKKYIIGFLIGISFISGISYASTGTIGGLFEKIGGSWKLVGTNIKDESVGSAQLGTNSVTTTKIVDKNVTEAKLSDAVVTKLNSPIVTETDPLSVKLTGNQTVGGIKTFTSSPIVPNPTSAMQVANKAYVDSLIGASSTSSSTSSTSSSTSSGGPTYTYSWNIGTWGTCNCTTYTQTRTVTCQRSDGVIVSDSFCTSKPSTSQICPLTDCPCNYGEGSASSPSGDNICSGSWPGLVAAGSFTNKALSNGGSVKGTCVGSNVRNYDYTCPNKSSGVTTCPGGGRYIDSSDKSSSCYFSWTTRNAGSTINLNGENGGSGSATCTSGGYWDFNFSCPNKVAKSCSGGSTTVPSASGKTNCIFSWELTTANNWYSKTYSYGEFKALCNIDGIWANQTWTCK